MNWVFLNDDFNPTGKRREIDFGTSFHTQGTCRLVSIASVFSTTASSRSRSSSYSPVQTCSSRGDPVNALFYKKVPEGCFLGELGSHLSSFGEQGADSFQWVPTLFGVFPVLYVALSGHQGSKRRTPASQSSVLMLLCQAF